MTLHSRHTLSALALAISTFCAAPLAQAADTAGQDLPTASPAEVGVDETPLIYLSKWLRHEIEQPVVWKFSDAMITHPGIPI